MFTTHYRKCLTDLNRFFFFFAFAIMFISSKNVIYGGKSSGSQEDVSYAVLTSQCIFLFIFFVIDSFLTVAKLWLDKEIKIAANLLLKVVCVHFENVCTAETCTLYFSTCSQELWETSR